MLQSATDLRELSMRVEFCGDAEKLEPFPEIDFVDFFSSHPRLRSFEAQGAMFAAVANRKSLKQVITFCFYLDKGSWFVDDVRTTGHK